MLKWYTVNVTLADGSVVGCEIGSNRKCGHPGFDSHKAQKTRDFPDTPFTGVFMQKVVKVWVFPSLQGKQTNTNKRKTTKRRKKKKLQPIC